MSKLRNPALDVPLTPHRPQVKGPSLTYLHSRNPTVTGSHSPGYPPLTVLFSICIDITGCDYLLTLFPPLDSKLDESRDAVYRAHSSNQAKYNIRHTTHL